MFSTILSITVLRRFTALSGKRTGSYWDGFCTRPARVAASAMVRSLLLLLKYRWEAASIP